MIKLDWVWGKPQAINQKPPLELTLTSSDRFAATVVFDSGPSHPLAVNQEGPTWQATLSMRHDCRLQVVNADGRYGWVYYAEQGPRTRLNFIEVTPKTTYVLDQQGSNVSRGEERRLT